MTKRILFLLFAFALALTSCEDDENGQISTQQSAAVEDHSVAEANFNEAGDMSLNAYNTPTQAQMNGRTNGTITFTVTNDKRLNGATITLETSPNSTALNPQGIITIDFGTGKVDAYNVTRKGKIIVTYKGLRFLPTSTAEITFNGYEVNGNKVEGKRTITTESLNVNESTITLVVVDANGKVTFTDQTFVTRTASHTLKLKFGTTFDKNTVTVTGQASGKTRDNKDYAFLITRGLIFKGECTGKNSNIPAEGEATLTLDTTPILINYGDAGASCDNKIKVTVGTISADITVN